MSIPIVAIVGRPNVGKSSLLNMLSGKRISIVDPTAGVTRDRVSNIVESDDRSFELVDTGGYGIEDPDNLTEHIQDQIRRAIESAAVLLFVVDAKTGPVPLDIAVARLIRPFAKPVILTVNKVDGPNLASNATEFFSLGFDEMVMVSCQHRRGGDELLKGIFRHLGRSANVTPAESELKLAVVGKRNAGKSTLINTLAGGERVIVSEVAGTTRDSIDVRIEIAGRTITVIDTAGVRKRARMTNNDLEFYSFHRAQRSIRRADVVLLLIDSTADITDVDQKLAAYVQEEFRPVILVINKWDLVGDQATVESYGAYAAKRFPQLQHAPVACISAKVDSDQSQIVRLAFSLYEQASTRLTTGQLNKAVEDILQLRGPSSQEGKTVKVYYATQIDVRPPTIVLFVNHPRLITEEYKRFFAHQLRERTVLHEVPIRLLIRGHRGNERKDESV